MSWNWQWGQFFDLVENPSPDQILEFLGDLRNAFGLE